MLNPILLDKKIGQFDLMLFNFFHKIFKQQLELTDLKTTMDLLINSLFKKILCLNCLDLRLKQLLAVISLCSISINPIIYNK